MQRGSLKKSLGDPSGQLPKLIYVDLNHWIRLARGRLGRPGSERYGQAFDQLMAARASKQIVAPLSSTHYIEISRIRDPRQRADVALTMEAVSEYFALTSREVFLRDELRRSIASEVGVPYEAARPAITGFGYAHAFGQDNVRVQITGNLEQARRHADAAA